MRAIRFLALMSIAASLSACATFSSDEVVAIENDPEVLQARNENLMIELARVKNHNARLTRELSELKREKAALAAQLGPEDSGLSETARAELRDEPVLAVPDPLPPQASSAEPNQPVTMAEAPVEAAPRLVQPTFVVTDAVFENEENRAPTTEALFGVHLASYRSRDGARAGWRLLQQANPDQLGLLEPRVTQVEIPERGTFLRLVGGGVASKERATALCDALKSRDVYCHITEFQGEKLSVAATQ